MKNQTQTSFTVNNVPLRWRHFYIVATASLGQLIVTTVSTIAGIIIPLVNICRHPELSGALQGVVAAAELTGICIGSAVFGRLIDRYGYLFFYRFCPALILLFSLIAVFVPDIAVLTVCLFMIGIGIGGEYCLDSNYVSDLSPEKYKSILVGVTKAASALGNILAAGVAFALLADWENARMWPELMWIICGVAALMLLLRIPFHENPAWLVSKGKIDQADKAVKQFLGSDVTINPVADQTIAGRGPASVSFRQFISQNWKKVILTGVPWACQGVGVYGIGVFLPILVMALGLEHFQAGDAPVFHVIDSVKITLYISCIILPGFVAGLYLLNKNRKIISIQISGFILCTLCLLLLMPAYGLHWSKWIAIATFMGFEFFLNAGPNLTTYVLPPEIYSVSDAGQGMGIATSMGKIGAVVGVFMIPVLLKSGGAMLVLGCSSAVMALGAVVTYAFRKERATGG